MELVVVILSVLSYSWKHSSMVVGACVVVGGCVAVVGGCVGVVGGCVGVVGGCVGVVGGCVGVVGGCVGVVGGCVVVVGGCVVVVGGFLVVVGAFVVNGMEGTLILNRRRLLPQLDPQPSEETISVASSTTTSKKQSGFPIVNLKLSVHKHK